MTAELELVVGFDGGVKCIYDEALDLRELGKLQIARASHVEPDRDGFWWADMGPVNGPVLGPFKNRTEALATEREWLYQGALGLAGVRVKAASPTHETPSDEVARLRRTASEALAICSL